MSAIVVHVCNRLLKYISLLMKILKDMTFSKGVQYRYVYSHISTILKCQCIKLDKWCM